MRRIVTETSAVLAADPENFTARTTKAWALYELAWGLQKNPPYDATDLKPDLGLALEAKKELDHLPLTMELPPEVLLLKMYVHLLLGDVAGASAAWTPGHTIPRSGPRR